VLTVETDGDRLVVRRVDNPFDTFAGALSGVFGPGHLDALGDEW
jgi:hypothetical protein